MTLQITIDTDNAAFEGDWRVEAARILRQARLGELDEPGDHFPLFDINGNRVGKMEII